MNGADPDGLLERESELATLESLVDAAIDGGARVGMIEGAAGIGKSRLLAEARRLAAPAGMRILSARGGELEQDYAFGVLPAKGHVFAKTGTTIAPGDDGETLQLKAQNLAGYIETKSGRLVAYALMVNDAGPVEAIEEDVAAVLTDEALISNVIYENL